MSAAQQIEDQAARWLMQREQPGWDDTEQQAFDAWLQESMAHKAAFWRLEYGWRRADRIGTLGDAARIERPAFQRRWLRAAWRPLALAASIALIFATFVQFRQGGQQVQIAQQTITTALGGHKLVPLADGSRIELNTATVLHAAVTREKREVWLDSGEAYFEVAHSKEHPFVVYAGPRTITVLGTKFSVRRDGDKVTVSVLEGRVRVDEAMPGKTAEQSSSSTVTTGDIMVADRGALLVAAKSPEQVEGRLAWRDGMLSFDQTSLVDVAAEFNRYNARKLVIADRDTAAIRIGGTFRASNVEGFTRLLHQAYGLRVDEKANEVRISN